MNVLRLFVVQCTTQTGVLWVATMICGADCIEVSIGATARYILAKEARCGACSDRGMLSHAATLLKYKIRQFIAIPYQHLCQQEWINNCHSFAQISPWF